MATYTGVPGIEKLTPLELDDLILRTGLYIQSLSLYLDTLKAIGQNRMATVIQIYIDGALRRLTAFEAYRQTL